MKRIILTAAFAVVACAAGAQTDRNSKGGSDQKSDAPQIINNADAPNQKVNDDGTAITPVAPDMKKVQKPQSQQPQPQAKPAPEVQTAGQSQQSQPDQAKPAPQKKERDRMAISEKGVPATKSKPAPRQAARPIAPRGDQPAAQPK
jgi:hypothetical protein